MQIKTLIVDDHDLVRAGIRLMLHDINPAMEIHEASNAAEALLKMQREAELDAVLMDINLPDQNGLSLLKKVKSMFNCPVVIISAEEDQLVIEHVLQSGAVAYIPKSSEASTIRRELKAVVQQCEDYLASHPRPEKKTTQANTRDYMAGHIPRVELTEDMVHIISNLTKRQKEVLELLAAGKTNKQICVRLGLSDGTVKNHVTAILSTLGVNRRTKVALLAREYASRQG